MTQLPPSGWYPDPDDAALQRFWDGARWTDDRTPATPSPAAAADPDMPPPAGWYADPENPQTSTRYWDGTRWTEDRAPYSATAAKARSGGNEALVAAGYIFSLLIPIVGAVIGAVLLQKKNRHGGWVLGLSVFFIVLFIAIGTIDSN